MSSDCSIEVRNISKSYRIYEKPIHRLEQATLFRLKQLLKLHPRMCYRDSWALNNVSFDVKKGETVGIVGGNGSGKTTLLQIICGTLRPTGGSVVTCGRVGALLELGAGFNPEFTGRENVYLNAAILGMEEDEVARRFEGIIAFADIGEYIDQPVKTYSTGMFVRLAFSVQANVDPDILIVDEALSVGDAYFVHRCMLRIRELQERGTSILFVSHDANTVKTLCKRAIWLKDSRIYEIGPAADVVDKYLAYSFGRQVISNEIRHERQKEYARLASPEKMNCVEPSIPNCDRRLGDQKLNILGLRLYDTNFVPISSTLNEQDVILRLSVLNIAIAREEIFFVGYIFRNEKGVEIASNNSIIEGERFRVPELQSICNVRMKISLPCLYPGSYSFSVTVGYEDSRKQLHLSDRIENAVIFNILSKKELHVMMCFSTVFEVESYNV